MKLSQLIYLPAALCWLPHSVSAEKAKVFNFDVLEEQAANPVVAQEAKNPLENVDLDQLVNVVYITLEPSTVYVTVTRTLHQVVTTATTTVTPELEETPTLELSTIFLNRTTTTVASLPLSSLSPVVSSTPVASITSAPSSTDDVFAVPTTSGKLDFVIGKDKAITTSSEETVSYYEELVQFVSSVFSPPPTTEPLHPTSTYKSTLISVASSTSLPQSSPKSSTKSNSSTSGKNGALPINSTKNSTKDLFEDEEFESVLDGFNPYKDLPLSNADVDFSNGSSRLDAKSVIIGMVATLFIFGVIVRHKPVDHHVKPTKLLVPEVHSQDHEPEPEIRDENVPILLVSEQWRGWIEVTLANLGPTRVWLTERLDVVKDKSQKFRFHVRNIGGSNVSNNKHGGDISEHVVQRPRKGSFKAVLWNSVQDLLETVVRSGEHVSVGVDSSFDIWVLGESSQVLGFRHSGRIHGNTCCNSGHRKKGGLFSGYKNAQGKNFHCNQ
ncbi:hypothetical protein OGAPHI_005470 [Ogataea philodendri]|uniref:Uncharacterized protein n=1 Tax=Ogataea philodendri TaxID=1378263 RepID=A0A9P8NZ32_9ASCO|nr:uncharacterized protein OGAPHI_005470 [Ogataea philodendri]KAH3662222.1 hypothetical protein OGAPHI_005470 [Ogataea philodendri]